MSKIGRIIACFVTLCMTIWVFGVFSFAQEDISATILSKINDVRTINSAQELTLNPQLEEIALLKAQYYKERNITVKREIYRTLRAKIKEYGTRNIALYTIRYRAEVTNPSIIASKFTYYSRVRRVNYEMAGIATLDNKIFVLVLSKIPMQATTPTTVPTTPTQPTPTQPQAETQTPVPITEPTPTQPTEVPVTTAPSTPPISNPSPSVEITAEMQKMLDLINSERALGGAQALVFDDQVNAVALLKAQDMITNNYFSHISPTYGSPFDMLKQFNISYTAAGENLAGIQSVEAAHTAFMNSSGHRANILYARFSHIGIGIQPSEKYGFIYVQMFIAK